MKLTKEQARQVISHITNATNNGAVICPICKHSQWSVNNIITEMREFHNGDLIVGGDSAIMPFVSISCNNCGHTLFINAIKAGIIAPQAKPSHDNTNTTEGE